MKKLTTLLISLLVVSIVIIIFIYIHYESKISSKEYFCSTKINQLQEELDKSTKKFEELVQLTLDTETELKQCREYLNNQTNKKNEVFYKALENLNIYAYMKEDSAILGAVPSGEAVIVINSFFGEMWEIEYNGIRGWVKAQGEMRIGDSGIIHDKLLEKL